MMSQMKRLACDSEAKHATVEGDDDGGGDGLFLGLVGQREFSERVVEGKTGHPKKGH